MSQNIRRIETAVVARPRLKGSSRALYLLLTEKYRQQKPLEVKELVFAWCATVVKEDHTWRAVVAGETGRMRVKTIPKQQYVRQNWKEFRGLAVNWLKYHIGNLVASGYLIAIPVLNLQVEDEPERPRRRRVATRREKALD